MLLFSSLMHYMRHFWKIASTAFSGTVLLATFHIHLPFWKIWWNFLLCQEIVTISRKPSKRMRALRNVASYFFRIWSPYGDPYNITEMDGGCNQHIIEHLKLFTALLLTLGPISCRKRCHSTPEIMAFV